MIKLLIGGSPCTYWSIAQKNNRETEPSGMGWELFKNYLIAKEKFKPDFFLYENNKSAAKAIKDEIKKQFGVWDGTFLMEDTGARYIEINSALVSAQNRQRFYVHNCGEVEQPEDRGILLRDILESGNQFGGDIKSYCLTGAYYKGENPERILEKHQRTEVAEPVCVAQRGRYSDTGNRSQKSEGKIEQFYEVRECGKTNALTTVQKDNMVAEPVRIPEYGAEDKAHPINSYYANNCGGFEKRIWSDIPNKQQVDMIAEPVNITADGKAQTLKAQYENTSTVNICCYKSTYGATGVAEPICLNSKSGRVIDGQFMSDKQPSLQDRIYSTEGKATAVTTSFLPKIIEPVRVGDMGSKSQGMRVYAVEGKSVCLSANGGGLGAKTGLYAIPKTIENALPKLCDKYGYIPEKFNAYNCAEITDKSPTLSTGSMETSSCATSIFEKTDKPIYEVRNGLINIKDKQYPIKLKDGYYIIRKLTVTECCRLQTMPDDYCRAVSNSQAYKGLGNGWTAEVIIHILSHALKDVPKDEKIVVLSMYDGIGTGRYCLDKMGFTNVEYHAYEIDKYAMQIAMSNYPDIIQHGDAFQIREQAIAV